MRERERTIKLYIIQCRRDEKTVEKTPLYRPDDGYKIAETCSLL